MEVFAQSDGWRYETCRIAGLRQYPTLQNLEAGRNAQIPTETGMFYDRVLASVFIVFSFL